MPKGRGVGEVILNVPTQYSKMLLYGAGSQLKENIKAMTIQVSLYVPFWVFWWSSAALKYSLPKGLSCWCRRTSPRHNSPFGTRGSQQRHCIPSAHRCPQEPSSTSFDSLCYPKNNQHSADLHPTDLLLIREIYFDCIFGS
jgi:hypothetical protein